MRDDTEKHSFHLPSDEEGWPPVAVENIWLEPVGDDAFRVKSSPFFVKGLAYADIVTVEHDRNGDVQGFRVIAPSGYSTIWLHASDSAQNSAVSKSLGGSKWPCEGLSAYRLWTIALPQTVSMAEFDHWVGSHGDDHDLEVAYPCLRHKG
jgi:hypothetical protein